MDGLGGCIDHESSLRHRIDQPPNVVAHIATLPDKPPQATVPGDVDHGRRLFQMGDKSESFVRQAHQVVRDHGDVLPLGLSLEQMDRDMDLRETLLPLHQRLSQMRL